ncbi:hypothetical protein BaRGS_00027799 [Batillaria attramentaria]|uniref:Uncharacterized protein n=1 Tax=Batillaria attramentaria TaxID=370345 RepID=A0ABD0K1D3_9CAEN
MSLIPVSNSSIRGTRCKLWVVLLTPLPFRSCKLSDTLGDAYIQIHCKQNQQPRQQSVMNYFQTSKKLFLSGERKHKVPIFTLRFAGTSLF